MKFGIIGLGNIGLVHARNLLEGAVRNGELVAVANNTPERFDDFRARGVACFGSAEDLVAAGLADAAIVALPTFLHTPVGTQVLEAGLHLVMEKPLACHKAEGERLLAARKRDDQLFALMMNQRTHPCYARIKQWIDSGEIGALRRVSWTMTNWFRPEIYYQSSPWRATWKGEGGGVLMNQCPHNLDILQWLVGLPSSIRAWCGFGKHHDIEVEDEASAFFEFPNGATGQFVASTGESPGTNRLEIVGDLGTVTTDGASVRLVRNSEPAPAFSRSTDEMFGAPDTSEEVYTPKEPVNQHAAILDNFIKAARGEEALIAPAEEGLRSLELAGAMIYSGWTGEPVPLPLDGLAYEAALLDRIAQSKPRQLLATAARVDMSKSYR